MASRKAMARKSENPEKKLSAIEVQNRVREEHRKKIEKRILENPTVETLILFWRSLLSEYGISSRTLSFNAKERGFMKSFIKQFTNGSGCHLREFLEFAVSHWSELRKKIVWDNNPKRSRLNEVPVFVEVYLNREDILHYMENKEEVQTRAQKQEVFTDLKSVPKNHPRYEDIVLMIKHTGRAVLQ